MIVDSAPAVRQALRSTLESLPHLWIVGEAEMNDEALRLAWALGPDIVVVGMNTPDRSVYRIARSLKSMSCPPAIVGLAAWSAFRPLDRTVEDSSRNFNRNRLASGQWVNRTEADGIHSPSTGLLEEK